MPFYISLKRPTLPLSSIKFLQQIDIPSSSYELFSAYTWNLHFTTLPVFASNLGLGSTVRLEKFHYRLLSYGQLYDKIFRTIATRKVDDLYRSIA